MESDSEFLGNVSPTSGFNEPIYITNNAKNFFAEADYGSLKEQMTEPIGVSSWNNVLSLLLLHLEKENAVQTVGVRKIYTITPLMNKHFYVELAGKEKLTFSELAKLVGKIKDNKLQKFTPYIVEQREILNRFIKN